MLRILDGLNIVARAAIAPADNQILVSSVDALKLNALAVGDHIYISVSDGRGTEVFKYTHAAPIVAPPGTVNIPVDRAQAGTTRRAWPIKSCLHTACCTEAVLREFIKQVIEQDIGVC